MIQVTTSLQNVQVEWLEDRSINWKKGHRIVWSELDDEFDSGRALVRIYLTEEDAILYKLTFGDL